MKKRLISLGMAALLCLSMAICASAAVLAKVEATYCNGVASVSASGLSAGTDYTVRVVNKTMSSITALTQAMADVNGALTASITTGELTTLTDYVVYINSPYGELVAQDSTLSDGTPAGGTDTKKPDVNTIINTVITTVPGTSDVSGKVNATVTSDAAQSLIKNAKQIESSGSTATVVINVSGASASGVVEIDIGKDDFKSIAAQTDAKISINATVATVTFDPKAVDTIARSTTNDLKIELAKVDSNTLSATVKSQVGDRPVYDFTITSGSSKISDFGGGSASISVPYTPKAGEDSNAIIVYYIDAAGTLNMVQGAYDAAAGTVKFTTTHFSSYVIGYNKVSFIDVASTVWYAQPVTFIAARGITVGVDSTHFAPDLSITRAQFIVMLLKAYGVSPLDASADNFTDAGSTYYTGYLAAAKNLGITTGVGGNKYEPESLITRQESFTLAYRTLKLLGEIPAVSSDKTVSSFTDGASVADYSKEAINALIGAGIVSGSNGKLNPAGNCTRAEMAQIIYNLLIA